MNIYDLKVNGMENPIGYAFETGKMEEKWQEKWIGQKEM